MNDRSEGSEPTELIFALCHEVGNLLAASRMQANLLDPGSDSGDIARTANTISTLAGRMGSLVSLVRPILSEAPASALPVDALDLLDGLQQSLDESCNQRVRFELKSAVDLPQAVIDADALHHVLMTAIYLGLEDSDPNGAVAVSVRAQGSVLTFTIEAGGPDRGNDGAVRGRVLSQQVADAVLRTRGGRIDEVHANGANRVEVSVPAEMD